VARPERTQSHISLVPGPAPYLVGAVAGVRLGRLLGLPVGMWVEVRAQGRTGRDSADGRLRPGLVAPSLTTAVSPTRALRPAARHCVTAFRSPLTASPLRPWWDASAIIRCGRSSTRRRGHRRAAGGVAVAWQRRLQYRCGAGAANPSGRSPAGEYVHT
jgi:hypothetical protein